MGTVSEMMHLPSVTWNRITTACLIIVLLVLTAVLFAPQIPKHAVQNTDFYYHKTRAARFAETAEIRTSNFLYDVLAGGLHVLLPFVTIDQSTFLVALFGYLLTAVLLFLLLRQLLPSFLLVPVALMLSLISPISVFTWARHDFYYGYVPITVFHNPTLILVRPIALLLFFQTLRLAFAEKEPQSSIFVPAVLVIAATLIKPNYAMCLIPALIPIALYRKLKGKDANIKAQIFGIVIPAIAVLGWQYQFTFHGKPWSITRIEPATVRRTVLEFNGQEHPPLPLPAIEMYLFREAEKPPLSQLQKEFNIRSEPEVRESLKRVQNAVSNRPRFRNQMKLLQQKIRENSSRAIPDKVIFAPFLVVGAFSTHLLPKFFLSILFPLAATIFYFPRAIQDRRMQLAWLVFLVAAFQDYFLAESGARMYHWNFVWGAKISLFILFIISATVTIEQNRPLPKRLLERTKLYVLTGVFALHVLSGAVWYWFALQFPLSLGTG